MAALRPVDYAVIFAEPTADNLLRAVRPDVYVKGGDYTEATLPEAATAREVSPLRLRSAARPESLEYRTRTR